MKRDLWSFNDQIDEFLGMKQWLQIGTVDCAFDFSLWGFWSQPFGEPSAGFYN